MRFTQFLKLAYKPIPTGLTGINTIENPRPMLIEIYKLTLESLKSKYPQESVYRTSLENLTKQRLKIVEENENRELIEEKIADGLIEEVILQAKTELSLVDRLAKEQPWKPLEVEPPADQWKYFDRFRG